MSNDDAYDATRDPRTGGPVLPIEEENARQRQRDVESAEPLDDENAGDDEAAPSPLTPTVENADPGDLIGENEDFEIDEQIENDRNTAP